MISIVTTGGTIEGLEYDSEENKSQNVGIQIEKFFDQANVSFNYSLDRAFSKDSRFIEQKDRELLSKKIESFGQDKILITHGTISMVETAKYLGKLGFKKTIVLVGSFISGIEENTDAPFNLGYALSAVQNLNHGVYIAMHGKVFPWDNVVKNMGENRFENIS